MEASIWQEVTFEVMKEVAKQLVWSVKVTAEQTDTPHTHNPYQ